MGLSKNPTVKQSHLESFGVNLTAQIMAQVKAVVQQLLPKQEEGNTSIEDLRSDKDKDYEKNLNVIAANVAKNGVKLVTISGRFGPETHNMSDMQAKTIMDIQREKKQYRTRL
jgi:L-fucose isomerase-like protein